MGLQERISAFFDLGEGPDMLTFEEWAKAIERLAVGSGQLLAENVTNTPPPSPTIGQIYIIGTAPTGIWQFRNNQVAWYANDAGGAAWTYLMPIEGMVAYNKTLGIAVRYVAGAWTPATEGGFGLLFTLWTDLAAQTTQPVGTPAEVVGDAGTHTDPVSLVSVSNSGRFRRAASGWQRVSDTLLVQIATLTDNVNTAVSNLTGVLGEITTARSGEATLDARIDAVANTASTASSTASSAASAASAAQAEINTARSGEASLDARIDAVANTASSALTAASNAQTEITNARSGALTLDARIDAVANIANDTQSEVLAARSGAGTLDARIDAVANIATDTQSEVLTARSGAATLDARIDAVLSVASGAATAASNAQTEITNARSGAASLDARIDGVEAAIDDIARLEIDFNVGGAGAQNVQIARDRFGTPGEIVVSPFRWSDGVARWEVSNEARTDIGAPCVMRVQRQKPAVIVEASDNWVQGIHWIPREHLVEKGIVPSDSSPPTIDLRFGVVRRSVGDTIGSTTFLYAVLRYGDIDASTTKASERTATDVTFSNTSTAPLAGYLGAGDNTTFAHTAAAASVGSCLQVNRTGIPIRDTYTGKTFTGIALYAWQPGTDAGISTLDMLPVVVVPGGQLPGSNTNILRDPVSDALPPVRASETGLSADVAEDRLKYLTPRSAAKTILFGESLQGFVVGPYGKAAPCLIADQTDHTILSFAKSGYDAMEIAQLIKAGINDHGPEGVRDFPSLGYCVVQVGGNDSIHLNTSTDHWLQNIVRLGELIEYAGKIPIFAGQYQVNRPEQWLGVVEICRQRGWQYWDTHNDFFQFEPSETGQGTATRDADYWGDGSHAGLRAHDLIARPLIERLQSIRPDTAFKIYRPRRLPYQSYRRVRTIPQVLLRWDGQSIDSDGVETADAVIVAAAHLVDHPLYGWMAEFPSTGARIQIPGSFSASYSLNIEAIPGPLTTTQYLSVTGTQRRVELVNADLRLIHSGNVVATVPYPYPAGELHCFQIDYDATNGGLIIAVDGEALFTATGIAPTGATGPDTIGGSSATGRWTGTIGRYERFSTAMGLKQLRKIARHLESRNFGTPAERNLNWQSIAPGHRHLPAVVDPYFDKGPSIGTDHGGFSAVNSTCEYEAMMRGEATTHLDEALVHWIVDSTADKVRALEFKFDGPTGAKVYVKRSDPVFEYNVGAQAHFFECATRPNVVLNAIYTDSQGGGSVRITAEPKRNERPRDPNAAWIVACAIVSGAFGVDRDPGTLTLTSGTGDAVISYTGRYTGHSGSEYDDRGGPYGGWLEVPVINGRVTLRGGIIREVMHHDEIYFVVAKRGSFTIRNPSLRIHGGVGKPRRIAEPLRPPREYRVLSANTTFDSATGWTFIGGATIEDNPDSARPAGISKVVRLSKDRRVRMAINPTASDIAAGYVQVWAVARGWFPKYVAPANEAAAALDQERNSWSTRETPDQRTLGVNIITPVNSTTYLPRYGVFNLTPIGMYWWRWGTRIEIPTAAVYTNTNPLIIELWCDDDVGEILLGKVWPILEGSDVAGATAAATAAAASAASAMQALDDVTEAIAGTTATLTTIRNEVQTLRGEVIAAADDVTDALAAIDLPADPVRSGILRFKSDGSGYESVLPRLLDLEESIRVDAWFKGLPNSTGEGAFYELHSTGDPDYVVLLSSAWNQFFYNKRPGTTVLNVAHLDLKCTRVVRTGNVVGCKTIIDCSSASSAARFFGFEKPLITGPAVQALEIGPGGWAKITRPSTNEFYVEGWQPRAEFVAGSAVGNTLAQTYTQNNDGTWDAVIVGLLAANNGSSLPLTGVLNSDYVVTSIVPDTQGDLPTGGAFSPYVYTKTSTTLTIKHNWNIPILATITLRGVVRA